MSKMNKLYDFEACIGDLLKNADVMAMEDIRQHVNINCLDHSLFVAYMSYKMCRFLGWDAAAAARGGLLHDLFLYDQKNKDSHEGSHLTKHPKTALENANRIFELTDVERDIIVKHMWPLTLKLPKYKESLAIILMDKVCAFTELLYIYNRTKLKRRLWAVRQPAMGM